MPPKKGKGKGKNKGKGKAEGTADEQQQQQKKNEIPKNVAILVLSKFPVKSLLRLSVVCRTWRNLVLNPKFITLHMNNSSTSLIIQNKPRGVGDNRYYLYETQPLEDHYRFVLKNPTDDAETEKFPACPHNSLFTFRNLLLDDDILSIVGVINGVICLNTPYWDGRFVLWNPATKQIKCIEPMNNDLFEKLPHKYVSSSLGFGYDPVRNHFAIIKILMFGKESGVTDISYVCPVNMESWREVKNRETGFWVTQKKCDTIVDGFPCWRSSIKSGEDFLEEITCFDLVGNLFFHIPMPEGGPKSHLCLVGYKNSLAMVAWEESDTFIMDFLVAVDKKWNRMFHIGPISGVPKMVGCWRSSDVILEAKDEGSLTMYNIETNDRKSFRVEGSKPGSFEVFDFQETLVPLRPTFEGTTEKTEPELEPSLRRTAHEERIRLKLERDRARLK